MCQKHQLVYGSSTFKASFFYDLPELFRFVMDCTVVQLFEMGFKKLVFVAIENYYIVLKSATDKKLTEKIMNNLNHRHEFRKTLYIKYDDHEFDIDSDGIAHVKHINAERSIHRVKWTTNLDGESVLGIYKDYYLEYENLMDFLTWF